MGPSAVTAGNGHGRQPLMEEWHMVALKQPGSVVLAAGVAGTTVEFAPW